MSTRVHAALPGARRPPQGPFGECVGCSFEPNEQVLGGGAAGSLPRSLVFPRPPKVEPLKIAEAF